MSHYDESFHCYWVSCSRRRSISVSGVTASSGTSPQTDPRPHYGLHLFPRPIPPKSMPVPNPKTPADKFASQASDTLKKSVPVPKRCPDPCRSYPARPDLTPWCCRSQVVPIRSPGQRTPKLLTKFNQTCPRILWRRLSKWSQLCRFDLQLQMVGNTPKTLVRRNSLPVLKCALFKTLRNIWAAL